MQQQAANTCLISTCRSASSNSASRAARSATSVTRSRCTCAGSGLYIDKLSAVAVFSLSQATPASEL